MLNKYHILEFPCPAISEIKSHIVQIDVFRKSNDGTKFIIKQPEKDNATHQIITNFSIFSGDHAEIIQYMKNNYNDWYTDEMD